MHIGICRALFYVLVHYCCCSKVPRVPRETCTQLKKQQLEVTWNNGLVPNWERSMSRLYTVTLLI